MGASSGHANRVNVLMMDGSLRGVTPTIDPKVWQAMGTVGDDRPALSESGGLGAQGLGQLVQPDQADRGDVPDPSGVLGVAGDDQADRPLPPVERLAVAAQWPGGSVPPSGPSPRRRPRRRPDSRRPPGPGSRRRRGPGGRPSAGSLACRQDRGQGDARIGHRLAVLRDPDLGLIHPRRAWPGRTAAARRRPGRGPGRGSGRRAGSINIGRRSSSGRDRDPRPARGLRAGGSRHGNSDASGGVPGVDRRPSQHRPGATTRCGDRP